MEIDLETLLTPPTIAQDATEEEASETYTRWFDTLTETLLAHAKLVVGKETFKFLELECYLRDPEHLPDPFTHGHADQAEPARWYFHKLRNSNSYVGGTRKGLDVTIGGNSVRGGILIRRLARDAESMADGPASFIDGPSKVLDVIFDTLHVKNSAEMVETQLKQDLRAWPDASPLHIRLDMPSPKELPRKRRRDEPIYKGYRIGLLPGNGKPSLQLRLYYMTRFWRYFVMPEAAQHKIMNAISLLHQGYDVEDVQHLLAQRRPSNIHLLLSQGYERGTKCILACVGKQQLRVSDLVMLYGAAQWWLNNGRFDLCVLDCLPDCLPICFEDIPMSDTEYTR
ncbi:hypothetical protein BZG36_01720 [Bifiguratus adelaidae]|uniref:Uncharacterized protein n=1 Tax=Bifiguratus adelaidae TaxID=1938954 RepID=A0A261Y4R2_9FUNG|nr:hypothetical protein BZG36_01720 [Bifiguratus adelaidae]